MSKLSPFGKFVKMAVDKVDAVVVVKFDWKDAILDSAILAGISFFASLGGAVLSSCSNPFLAAGFTAGSTFFATMAIKRGLVSK
jgi:hypothetical protein